jgi:hypothetical protein
LKGKKSVEDVVTLGPTRQATLVKIWLNEPPSEHLHPHTGKHPFSLNLGAGRIAQILLLSGIDGPFCNGCFNPFESFFLLWIWTVIITHPDVHINGL